MHVNAHRFGDIWNVPGWLSLSRVGFAAAFPYVAEDRPWAAAIVGAAAISDYLDGYVARRFHKATAIGAALDPITDKIFAISVMVTLVATARLTIAQALLVSVRELVQLPLAAVLLFAPRARTLQAASLGSNVLGKLTTALQLGALLSLLFAWPGLDLWIGATAILGAIAAASYTRRFVAALVKGRGADRVGA